MNNLTSLDIEFKNALSKNVLFISQEYFEDSAFHPFFKAIDNEWQVVMDYVIKEFLIKEYKIRYSRKTVNTLRCKGLWIISLFRLCERVCSLSNNYKTHFDSSSDLFMRCTYELRAKELSKFNNSNLINAPNLKKTWMLSERTDWRRLKIQQNPYTNSYLTGLNLLVETSLKLCDYSSFVKDIWNPYLRAYSAYISDYQKNTDIGILEINDHIVTRKGRGKGGETRTLHGKTTDFKI